ncbi:MAG: hypothetical protein WBE76_05280 [Terracidiphilus sp.]
MNSSKRITTFSVLFFAAALHAASLEPLREHCSIAPSEHAGKLSLRIESGDCSGVRHCNSNFSSESFDRFTGVTLADLANDGAHLTATLTAEAGTFACTGTVQQSTLEGDSLFTPDAAFVARMDQMGFTGLGSEKLMAYAFIGIDSAWARSMQQTGIQGLNIDNLLALRIFKADPEYIRNITALGYDMPTAEQLIGLKVQGVNAEEVREIRALGYQPTLDELVQIRIFKITPDFIRRMQARGFKNLTIAKLVQIRIFNLAD